MTPLELFEAIGKINPDSIQDSIQLSLDDTLASEAEQDNKAAHKNPVPAKAAGIREQPPAERRYGIALLPYLLTAGCTAACIAGFGLMIRFSIGNEIVGTQSEIPISVQESVSSMTTAVSTGERAVLTAITETHTVQQTVTVTAEDRTEPVSVTETDAVTETAAITETRAAVTAVQTEPPPLTSTTAADTQTETTVTEPPPPVYEMGDVDMDGQITFVDAALVHLDWLYACQSEFLPENNPDNPPEKEWLLTKWDHAPLTPEQRILGNVNGKADKLYLDETDSPTFPLSKEDAEIIFQVAKLRNWHQMDVSFEDYIEQHEEYLEQFHEVKHHYVYEPRKEECDLAFLQEENISLEEWKQSLTDATLLYNDLAGAGFSFRELDGIYNPFQFDTEEEFYQHYCLVMTVEEFYKQAEVMKEKYFKNGWKRSLSDESN